MLRAVLRQSNRGFFAPFREKGAEERAHRGQIVRGGSQGN